MFVVSLLLVFSPMERWVGGDGGDGKGSRRRGGDGEQSLVPNYISACPALFVVAFSLQLTVES